MKDALSYPLAPNSARDMCPPSIWLTGNRFRAVIIRPKKPASPNGWISTIPLKLKKKNIILIIGGGSMPPTATNGLVCDKETPRKVTITATMKPYNGPAIPMSNS